MQVHSWDCCGHLDQRKASQHPLCLAQVASPCMPWSTSPSHCPGVSPHPVPPTDTAEDWGQNLACGISSWPGSGIFPTLSTFSPWIPPPVQNQAYSLGGLATISAALEPKASSPYESLLCGRARGGGCALPRRSPSRPGRVLDKAGTPFPRRSVGGVSEEKWLASHILPGSSSIPGPGTEVG